MRKFLIALLAVSLLLSLAACGGGNNNGGSSTTTPPANSSTPGTSQGGSDTPSNNGGTPSGTSVEWPENDYTKDFPKPNKGTIKSAEEVNLGGVYFKVEMNWTLEEAKEYAEQLKAAGFEGYLENDDEDFYNFSAASSDRRGLRINYSVLGSDVVANITFTKPSSTGESTATEQPNGAGDGENSGSTTEKPDSNTSSKPTKEEFLAGYGLTEDDLKPAGFIEMNAWSCEKNEGDFFIQVDEASRGVAEIEEWFKKVFGKLKSISDDGKIYQDPALTQEATYPSYNAYITDKQLLFNYKGQKVYVELRFSMTFANLKDEIKNKAQYEFYLNLYQ